MKNLFKTTVMALSAFAFTVAGCDSKPVEDAGNATEETMDAAGAEMNSPAAGDTAMVQDKPVEDGLVDSLPNN